MQFGGHGELRMFGPDALGGLLELGVGCLFCLPVGLERHPPGVDVRRDR